MSVPARKVKEYFTFTIHCTLVYASLAIVVVNPSLAVLRLPAITKLTPSASFTLGNKKKSISINGRVFQMLDGIFGAPTPTIHYSIQQQCEQERCPSGELTLGSAGLGLFCLNLFMKILGSKCPGVNRAISLDFGCIIGDESG